MRRVTAFPAPRRILFLLLAALAFADQPALGNILNGQITMSGSIATSACTMRVDSEDQTIDMGQLSLARLINGETTIQKAFRIYIEGCARTQTAGGDAKGSHPFALTFEGDSDSHLFVARGSARGVAMRLQDSNGHVILPGASRLEYMPPSGDTTLRYLLSLQGTGQALKAGNYQITVRLRMHYF
nr:fimbrial protein [uncultured Achromobacter sp.]